MRKIAIFVLAGAVAACSSPSAREKVAAQCEASGADMEGESYLAFCDCLKEAVPADTSDDMVDMLIQENLLSCKEQAGG